MKRARKCLKTLTYVAIAATSYPKKTPPSQDTTHNPAYATYTAPTAEKQSHIHRKRKQRLIKLRNKKQINSKQELPEKK